MLRHVVTWKMNGLTPAERNRQAHEIAAALRALPKLVPSIEHLEAHVNELDGYNNWDVTLISDFADVTAFEEYVHHPEHQKVVSIIKERAADRAGVDATV